MQPLQKKTSIFTNKSTHGNHEHHNWAESLLYKPKDNYSSIKNKVLAGDKTKTREYAKARIMFYLKDAAYKHNINKSKIATQENIDVLLKHLRIEDGFSNKDNIKWANWAEGVFQQIESGSIDLMASIRHWQNEMSSSNNKCTVVSIKLSGSDLHGKGLGAAFVKFSKVQGEGSIFKNKSKVDVVLKPEDRNIEKSLFGTQADSFANWVNDFAGLDDDHKIGTIEMDTHSSHGSIIEFVKGIQAQNLQSKEDNVHNRGMVEALVFSFLTGLTDLHKENVIWGGDTNQRPYMIDADNALNFGKMSDPETQTGFTSFNRNRTERTVNKFKNFSSATKTNSKIIEKLREDPDEFFDALKDAFSGKTGRIVPRSTKYWGQYLNTYKSMDDKYKEGLIADTPKNLIKKDGQSPGLKGECGESPSGGHYDQDEETNQLRVDFERGQIPFYSYDYSTGYVSHNGHVIWRGRSIDDAITDLRAKLGL